VWTGLPNGGQRLESWFRQIQIARSHPSPIGGDGQANATAADFLDELAGGTLTFSWYTYAYTQTCDGSGCATVVDPRGFYATRPRAHPSAPSIVEALSQITQQNRTINAACATD
jgi:hypothetical protein